MNGYYCKIKTVATLEGQESVIPTPTPSLPQLTPSPTAAIGLVKISHDKDHRIGGRKISCFLRSLNPSLPPPIPEESTFFQILLGLPHFVEHECSLPLLLDMPRQLNKNSSIFDTDGCVSVENKGPLSTLKGSNTNQLSLNTQLTIQPHTHVSTMCQ